MEFGHTTLLLDTIPPWFPDALDIKCMPFHAFRTHTWLSASSSVTLLPPHLVISMLATCWSFSHASLLATFVLAVLLSGAPSPVSLLVLHVRSQSDAPSSQRPWLSPSLLCHPVLLPSWHSVERLSCLFAHVCPSTLEHEVFVHFVLCCIFSTV